MAYAIRTKYNLQALNKEDDSDYIKQIYIKNKTWNPEPAPLHIEDKITDFEKLLKHQQNNLSNLLWGKNLSNLTYPQSVTLHLLKCDNNLTIKPTDKNLGPAIMETKDYINQILDQHLLTKDYERLSEETAKHRINAVNNTLKSLIWETQNPFKGRNNIFRTQLQKPSQNTHLLWSIQGAQNTYYTQTSS